MNGLPPAAESLYGKAGQLVGAGEGQVSKAGNVSESPEEPHSGRTVEPFFSQAHIESRVDGDNAGRIWAVSLHGQRRLKITQSATLKTTSATACYYSGR